jgi:serine/threonine protein kinase
VSGESAINLQVGDLLAGKYRVEALLGRGGMGAVYLAENTDIGRKVAIKVLNPELARDPDTLARFKQEARAAAAIGHPGIVDVLDLGTAPDGSPFLVMERLEGETLRQRLSRERTMAPQAAAEIVAAALDALASAHEKGVIHRDLKPDNLFLVARPVPAVKVLDFGISKFRGGKDVHLTRTGAVMGTPLYMSPEQARGAKDITPATDIYSAGAILYEALAGQPPYPGESYNEVIAKVLTEPLRPLAALRPDAPPALVATLEGMLAKPIEHRPGDARSLAQALRGCVQAGAAPSVSWTVAPVGPGTISPASLAVDPLGSTTPSGLRAQGDAQVPAPLAAWATPKPGSLTPQPELAGPVGTAQTVPSPGTKPPKPKSRGTFFVVLLAGMIAGPVTCASCVMCGTHHAVARHEAEHKQQAADAESEDDKPAGDAPKVDLHVDLHAPKPPPAPVAPVAPTPAQPAQPASARGLSVDLGNDPGVVLHDADGNVLKLTDKERVRIFPDGGSAPLLPSGHDLLDALHRGVSEPAHRGSRRNHP